MKIKEVCPKPSDAIMAMVRGLRNHTQREGFKLDTRTYGFVDEKAVCFGCVATCCVQEIAKVNFDASNIGNAIDRSVATRIAYEELTDFERSINALRVGDEYFLGQFYQLHGPKRTSFEKLARKNIAASHMYTDNWQEFVGDYEKFAEELKAVGL